MEYKITIDSIETTEYPETEYKYIDSKTGEDSEYGKPNAVKDYYKTGKMLTRTDTLTVFEQRMKSEDLNLKDVIKAINQLT